MTSLSATAPTSAQGASTSASAAATSFAGGDFETFLKMLTTQIRNQDPLNPMEGSDFAVQLATFSGVEQQVRTNQLLEHLAVGQSGGLVRLADWIGKEVRTTAPVAYGGEPLTLDIRPGTGATRVELVTLDANGREVLREDIGLGTGEVDWAGRTSAGPLADGLYSFKLVSYRGDEVLKTDAVGAYARVTGAELTAEGVRLSLQDGASALESQVTALREAS
jgi:flagellar basal-body rod modification protein FlgD